MHHLTSESRLQFRIIHPLYRKRWIATTDWGGDGYSRYTPSINKGGNGHWLSGVTIKHIFPTHHTHSRTTLTPNLTPSIIQEIFKSLLSRNPVPTLRMELYSETFVIVVKFVALVGLVNICIIRLIISLGLHSRTKPRKIHWISPNVEHLYY